MHGTTYGSLNWRDRAKERKRRAEELNDTLAAYCRFYWRVRASDLVLRRYGIRLIANDRVFHVYEDWPGLDRRKVSGSAWDGRKLIWRKPSVRDYPHKPGKLTNGPKVRCAHIGAGRVPSRYRGHRASQLLTVGSVAPGRTTLLLAMSC